jgi:hypothetical protein
MRSAWAWLRRRPWWIAWFVSIAAALALLAVEIGHLVGSSSPPAPSTQHVNACRGYYEVAIRDLKRNARDWRTTAPTWSPNDGVPFVLQESAWRLEMVIDLCFETGGVSTMLDVTGPSDLERAVDDIERGWRASTVGGPWRMP